MSKSSEATQQPTRGNGFFSKLTGGRFSWSRDVTGRPEENNTKTTEKPKEVLLSDSQNNYDDLSSELGTMNDNIVPNVRDEESNTEVQNDKPHTWEEKGKDKIEEEETRSTLTNNAGNSVEQISTNDDVSTVDEDDFTVIPFQTPEAPVLTLSNTANNVISDLVNGLTKAHSSSALTNLNAGLSCFANVGTNAVNLAVSVYGLRNDFVLISTITGAAELAVNLGAPTVSYLLGSGVIGTTATMFTHGAVALAATHPLAIPVVATALVAAYDYQTLINTAKSGIDITVSFAKGTAALVSAGVDTVVIPAAMILDLYNLGKNGIKSPHFPVKFDGETITLALTDEDEATTIGEDWVAVTDEANPTADNIDFSEIQDTTKGKQVNNLGQIVESTEQEFPIKDFVIMNNSDSSTEQQDVMVNVLEPVDITGSDSMQNAN